MSAGTRGLDLSGTELCRRLAEGRDIPQWFAFPEVVRELRDRKGLYAKARAGLIPEFTGISSPYEPPMDAEVVVDTTASTPEEATQDILLHLQREGYIGMSSDVPAS